MKKKGKKQANAGTRGSQGKGRKLELSFFACVKGGWGFGAAASSIF